MNGPALVAFVQLGTVAGIAAMVWLRVPVWLRMRGNQDGLGDIRKAQICGGIAAVLIAGWYALLWTWELGTGEPLFTTQAERWPWELVIWLMGLAAVSVTLAVRVRRGG